MTERMQRLPASDRVQEYADYRLRVKGCQLCGDDVEHTGRTKAVPAYLSPNKCKILIVTALPDPDDHTRQQVTVLTGERGKVVSAAMADAGLSGDNAFGFTPLVKCKLVNGRVKRRCMKQCIATHFQYELDFVQPKVIVLLGLEAAKAVVPELVKAGINNDWAMDGRAIFFLDQWYVFARDPESCLQAKKLPKEITGEITLLGSSFVKAKELL